MDYYKYYQLIAEIYTYISEVSKFRYQFRSSFEAMNVLCVCVCFSVSSKASRKLLAQAHPNM